MKVNKALTHPVLQPNKHNKSLTDLNVKLWCYMVVIFSISRCDRMPLEVRCAPLSPMAPPPTPSLPPTPASTPPGPIWDPTGPCARLNHWPMGLWALGHTDTRTPSLWVTVTVVVIISQGPRPQDPTETCLTCNLPAAAMQHCYLTPAQAR